MRRRRGLGDVSALRCGGTTYIAREALDSGGYARGGMYFGTGEKLWSFSNDESSGYLRAPTKAAAKKLIQAKCPADALAGARRRSTRKRSM